MRALRLLVLDDAAAEVEHRQLRQTGLDGSYGRHHEKALRVAALSASWENDGKIELRHWAKAQEMA